MRENSRLDKLDLKILNFIQKENKINYSKIGKELRMSHVDIKNRFEK
ncbi:MAG: AsnC family transcriptional regulator, partial [Promethearchaeota archaeon]